METTILVLLVLILVLLILIYLKLNNKKEDRLEDLEETLEGFRAVLRQDQDDVRADVGRIVRENLQSDMVTFSRVIGENTKNMAGLQQQQMENIDRHLQHKLDEMRGLVDEKLQQTLNDRMTESFKLVNDRLEQVYRGLGEMQSLAAGVGDLKRVLSNVKTRGILGEIQLGAILQEILTPEQYETNVATKQGSRDVVEFAVKLPTEQGGFVYLPIDSKFPGESYGYLQQAYESGDREAINACLKQLLNTIRAEAKDIRDKYLDPPNTTEFGIMFLPFEGLYAEVVNRGMVEVLQREYRVNIAGPSTMAAMLNSLQMSFRTFAIQKRSGEVWQVLGAVKTEFDRFEEALKATQNRLNQANDELDKLVGTRTRKMQQRLRGVTELNTEEAQRILRLDED